MSDGRVLVTGANGFVGRAVVAALASRGIPVTAAVRTAAVFGPQVRVASVGDLEADMDWSSALQGCDVVIHCAARVHVMRDRASDPLHAFRAVNVSGSARLASAAAAAGVRRFIFISSIKVHGETTELGAPLTEAIAPSPADAYGMSKLEAEVELRAHAQARGLELTIIRPPLVYGPGVKANFLAMTRWLRHGIPLPLGAITHNRRTLIALDNLVDLIICCTVHPAAAGQTFLAGDGEDLSTTELLRRTAQALGVTPRLIPVPAAVLSLGAALLGRHSLWQRLGGTLQASIEHARRTLDWSPPISVDEGLRRTVAAVESEGTLP